ncbi:thiamine pyrophosphokinase [Lecanora helva]
MDSIRPDVLQYYQAKGILISEDRDQFSTDIDKCLKHIRGSKQLEAAWNSKLGLLGELGSCPIDVALFGGLGGRVDQAFSQIHHLYAIAKQGRDLWNGDLFLITPEGIAFVLEKGANTIHAPVGPKFFTENVGIIPIGKPCRISTRGLEWDVTDWPTEFGTQISTSNHIRAQTIDVECTESVLLTLEYS